MVNYWAVLVAAVASFIVGMVWYHPKVFGTQWMKLSGTKPKGKPPASTMVIAFIANVVMAWVLSMFVIVGDLMGGLKVGFYLWLGLMATTSLGMVLWQGKSWNLWFLNNAYALVNVSVIIAIVVSWT